MQGSSIGDVMANKDGMSICSNSSNAQINNRTDYDDDISTLTSTTDNKLNSICKFKLIQLSVQMYSDSDSHSNNN